MTMLPSQEFVRIRSYSRWVEEEKRREAWQESVDRYFAFMDKKFGDKIPEKVWKKSKSAVSKMDVMPSMRALWAAGPALEQNNITGYNCCSLVFKDLQSVVELSYVLMCGAGVGFSIEDQFISQMPVVKPWTGMPPVVHVVGDSREGWALALKAGLEAWFRGEDIEFDYSRVRPRGARLKTMGGRASGPGPLRKLLDFCRELIFKAQGRHLNSLEWLDIGNMVGDAVVVGGVRRASEISFSDLDDDAIRFAKDFTRGVIPRHREMSNNSVAYRVRPDMITFMREWTALAASGSGERGIFNIQAAMNACERRAKMDPAFLAKYGYKTWEDLAVFLRTNPCGEIFLIAILGEFCNLSEVVVRAKDTLLSLIQKVKTAVWLGAMQACLTEFPFLRPSFADVCREERLLGVSLTGQMDNIAVLTEDNLRTLKQVAIAEARKASKALGINMPAAITTGKPSGTVSQLVDAASGAHPRYAKFYLRRYRISATDPLFRMMKDQGVEFVPENDQGPESIGRRREELIATRKQAGFAPLTLEELKVLVPDWDPDQVQTWVVAFPIKAPEGAVTRSDVTAVQQLEWYLRVKKAWCEHNQSMSVYVRDEEWLAVGSWVYEHFDEIGGISFFPYDSGGYSLAPYEELTEEQWKTADAAFPRIDYTQLGRYEEDDNTTGAQQLACSAAGGCDL
jgi:ribonucleoside-triphosphate reductase